MKSFFSSSCRRLPACFRVLRVFRGLLPSAKCLVPLALGFFALAASATTNSVEYVRIPVVRIPTTTVGVVEVSELQVEGLSLAAQSDRLSRLINQWGAVYQAVSGESIHPRSYFGRKRSAILKRAAAEGASDAVMEMLVDYQIQLNQYLKHRILSKEPSP